MLEMQIKAILRCHASLDLGQFGPVVLHIHKSYPRPDILH